MFVVSPIIHMALPFHKGDFRKMEGEEKVLDVMHRHQIEPGSYMFPCAGSMKKMSSPEMVEKCKAGPVGFMTIVPSGPPGVGKNLVLWSLYSILVGFACAYFSSRVLDLLADYISAYTRF